MLRFWLKDNENVELILKDAMRTSVKVETCGMSGKKYIRDYGSCVLDPTEKQFIIPEELIESVTAVEQIRRGLRTEGLYREGDATLVVKTRQSSDRSGYDEQVLYMSAPNLKAVQDIYSKFRQGWLKPAENWEADSVDDAEPTETKVDTDAPYSR